MLSSASELGVGPLSRAFRALGDETRLRIVALLAHGELCVCHVEQALGLSQPNASRQLGILRTAGLVESRRSGTWIDHRLALQEHAVVERLVSLLTDTFRAKRMLRADLARLRTRCGPGSCS